MLEKALQDGPRGGDPMAEEVLVCVDKRGDIASLHDGWKLVVYDKLDGVWRLVREKCIVLDAGLNMQELRRKMAEVITFAESCRMLVGLSITGIPYIELEKAGFSIWEVAGRPEDTLDLVLQREAEAQEAEREQREADGESLMPIEISPGHYCISLIKIQAKNAALSSKQVLLPLLRQNGWRSLEVLCSHVPPWLQGEILAGRLRGSIEQIGVHEEKIVITR
jgi:Fe-only nitrogenase accessory protein AnfO